MKDLKIFILGLIEPANEIITEFPDKITAENNSDEWVEVLGKDLEDAKSHYEAAFARWQKREGLTVGDENALNLPYYDKEYEEYLKRK